MQAPSLNGLGLGFRVSFVRPLDPGLAATGTCLKPDGTSLRAEQMDRMGWKGEAHVLHAKPHLVPNNWAHCGGLNK